MAPAKTAIQVIEDVYAAFQRGDIAAILQRVAPGAIWRQASTLPWGGDFRGPEGAAEFFRKLDEAAETTGFEIRENIGHGDEVFSFGVYSCRGRRSGRTGSAEWMFRWRVQDGKIVSYESYEDTAALLAAL